MRDLQPFIDRLASLRESEAQGTDAGGRNEATTRLQVIDLLLFEVLDWDRAACTSEDHLDGTYTDYSLGLPSKKLVLEAKREGTHFELPIGPGPLVVSLEALSGRNPTLKAAIDQVVGYCNSRGIRIASICNGHQLVAFVGTRTDGTPPVAGKAIVFRSLDDMEKGFVELWNCLSPDGIDEGHLDTLISGPSLLPPPPKLSRQLFGYPGSATRSEVDLELEIMGDLFLYQLIREPEFETDFLRECYCSSGALSQFSLLSRELLGQRYVTTEKQQGVVAAADKGGISPALQTVITTRGVTRRPIVLIGDVGVGKTSFLRHLILVDAAAELDDSVVLYVDFGAGPALRTDIAQYIGDQFEQHLLDSYEIDILDDGFIRGVYHPEIQRFRNGVFGPLHDSDPALYKTKELERIVGLTSGRESHLRRSFDHLVRGQNRRIVVFLDNVDQRDEQFQEAVFVTAQTFSESWPVTAFVTLRSDTYAKSRRHGSLSAYQPRVFTIAPPRVDLVLQKRLNYAATRLAGGLFRLGSEGITLNSELLRDYLQILLQSLSENYQLSEFMSNMSNGNVREALSLLMTFVGNPHVNSERFVNTFREQGRYQVPLHSFVQALALGEKTYFDPTSSPLPNIFDIISTDGREHFLVALIAQFVQGTAGTRLGQAGYVEEEEIFGYCQAYGFQSLQIEAAIHRMVLKALIESAVNMDSDDHAPALFRITEKGAYSVQRLCGMFAYLDAVVADTPITDSHVRSEIGDARTLAARADRVSLFVDYLDNQWSAIHPKPEGFDWTTHSASVRTELIRISPHWAH